MTTLTRQLIIVHLSDLHFGKHHRFDPIATPKGDAPSRIGYPTLAQKLLEDLAEPKTDCPVIVCITGDLATEASFGEFQQAEEFVSLISKVTLFGCQMQKRYIFLVPGNHDVLYNSDDIGERWQDWMELNNRIYDTQFKREECRKLVTLSEIEEIGAAVLTLNSSMYVQKGKPDEDRGHVDVDQLALVEESLEAIPSQKFNSYIRIALIHHHPVLIPSMAEPGRGYDAVHNSGKLLTILRRYGFHLVLHGHKHNPHTFTDDSRSAFGNTSHQPILIVAGGSAGSTSLPESPRKANTYNRITIKWHPAAGQSRVVVQTRGLSVFNNDGTERLPSRWKWETIDQDDRSFYGSRRLPRPSKERVISLFDQDLLEQDEARRRLQYEAQRGNMAIAEVLPSLEPDQAYEARLWIVPHKRSPEDEPTAVVWSAGRHFPTVRVTQKQDPNFCCTLSYWGPMLVQAKLEFSKGDPVYLHIYARIPQGYATTIGDN